MPYLKNNIFNRKNLNYLLSRIEKNSVPDLKDRQDVIIDWINYIQSGNIDFTKETALQGKFLDDIFSTALGYKSRIKNTEQWNLNQEQLTTIDSKFADGSLGFFSTSNDDVRVVIELKGSNISLDEKQHRHNDTRTPIEQAFSYQHKIGSKCKWVIVSNYKEIRLYHHSSSTEYEEFQLIDLGNWEHFRKFYFLLSIDNLISSTGDSVIDTLYAKNEVEEVNISKQFYLDFKQIRTKLFEHLKQNNPEKPELLLLEKTQKFLDRFIFLSFCEDNRLLPEKTFKQIIDTGKRSYAFSETKIWNELKGLFQAINVGSPPHNINKFNGGLFATDSELDELIIKDSILEEIAKLTEYDFETDVDVNILGHIFEQSISDLEEIKLGIEGKDFDKKTSKRKKDGIYYTPEYITKYIVENAVGGWLDDRKKELGFYELPELPTLARGIKPSANEKNVIQKHLDFWQTYKTKLMEIKVLDPACGSGAFLNQAFNFLYSEGQTVNDRIAELSGGQAELFGLDKHILSNNLFGVDLNSESVEITKLSLWIKTANAHAELTALDNNIKCGNSLIDDPNVSADKAFNWSIEFQEIMQNGGFDVVIGNPPYVRAELLSNFKVYLSSKYQVYNSGSDLFAYFYEKAISVLQKNGLMGFISNTFDKTTAGKSLRNFILKSSAIIKYVDFTDAKIFADATTYPIIIILKKNDSPDNSFGFIKMTGLNLIDNIPVKYIVQSKLNDGSWSFFSDLNNQVIQKIQAHQSILDKYGKCYRGIITGLNEAFIVSKTFSGSEVLKPVYEGKELKKWYTPKSSQKIILFKSKWTKTKYGHDIDEEKALLRLERDYPEIIKHLKPFTEEAKKRYDKGEFWWELRNCAYYDLFEKPKIVFPNLQNSNKFSIDDTGAYINAPAVFLPVNDKCLLAILNSLVVWYFLKSICVVRSGGFIEVKPQYFEQIPIPDFDKTNNVLIEYVDEIVHKQKALFELCNEFLTFIKNKFSIEKATTKLQNWHKLEYNEFLKELSKAKVNLPLEEQLSWQTLLTKQKALAQEFKTKIDETDKKIDAMVYEIYGLTEEEIKIVEGNKLNDNEKELI